MINEKNLDHSRNEHKCVIKSYRSILSAESSRLDISLNKPKYKPQPISKVSTSIPYLSNLDDY